MLPVVAIEIAAENPAPAYVKELLAACSSGLRGASCELQSDDPARPGSSAQRFAAVHIVWESATQVTLEATPASGNAGNPKTRTLTFVPTDEELERWRTVGFTAASMAGEPPQAAIPVAPPEPGWGLDLRGLAGTSAIGAEARLGLAAWLTVKPWDGPVGLSASALYAVSSVDDRDVAIELRWVQVGAGLSFGLVPEALVQAVLRVEVLAQSLEARGTLGGALDSAATLSVGARVGLDLALPARGPWAAVLGAEAQLLDAPTRIKQEGREVANVPLLLEALNLGVRYRF